MYILENSFKNLGRNKGRNILIGIILLGIITTTGISFIINTTASEIIESYKTRFGSEAFIVPDYEKIVEVGNTMEFKNITLSEYEKIAKSESVKEYNFKSEISLVSETIKAKDEEANSNVINMNIGTGGSDSSDEMSSVKSPTLKLISSDNLVEDKEFKNGLRKIIEGKMYGNINECIISEDLAKINNLKVGDEIEVQELVEWKKNKFTMKVVGIYKDLAGEYSVPIKNAFMNRRNEILTSFETISKVMGDNIYVSAQFILKTPKELENFTNDVRSVGIPEYYKVTVDEEGYKKVVEPVEGLTKVTNMFMIVVLALGGGILVLISIMSIRERKYEIGVLRAMGMKKAKVTKQFLYESIMLTSICLVIGISLSALLAQPVADNLLKSQIEILDNQKDNNENGQMVIIDGGTSKETYKIEELNVYLSSDIIIKIVVVSMALAVLSSIVSIVYIMKYQPMKILSERN